jgi:hypothetical protein
VFVEVEVKRERAALVRASVVGAFVGAFVIGLQDFDLRTLQSFSSQAAKIVKCDAVQFR